MAWRVAPVMTRELRLTAGVGPVSERSLAMKKKGKKDEPKGTKKGK